MLIADAVVILAALLVLSLSVLILATAAWMFAKATQATHAARVHAITADEAVNTFAPQAAREDVQPLPDGYVQPTRDDFLEGLRLRREMAASMASNGHVSPEDVGSIDGNDGVPPDYGATDVGGAGGMYRG